MGNFENPNLDSSSVKLYSKDGHSAIVTDSDLEGRTEITTSQQGACLNVEGKAGTSPGNDALVVEVCKAFLSPWLKNFKVGWDK